MGRSDKRVTLFERSEQRLSVLCNHAGEKNQLAFSFGGLDSVKRLTLASLWSHDEKSEQ